MKTFDSAPYKGTRDFYPEDFLKHQYIFDTWSTTLKNHGFEQYDTSVLENAELYIAKSGEELGGSQLYNFHDKGDRFVALRPEMTPSLARIVANKFGELRFPLRWFSIPNCFRYERPQKGRLREHWQLNVDIIGLEAGEAEVEILSMVGTLFKSFGATKDHFKVMYNHRQVLDTWLKENGIATDSGIYGILDDWFKLSDEVKKQQLDEAIGAEKTQSIFNLTSKTGSEWDRYQEIALGYDEIKLIQTLLPSIHPDLEYELNPCIIRGIAYYTGLVYEAFDKNPENSRALFGGGRYDTLLEMFGKSKPAIGFGWGDVTMTEFLNGHNLWPEDISKPVTKVGIMPATQDDLQEVYQTVLPKIINESTAYDIDYSYDRKENKRWETLKKRGCDSILKVGFDESN
jgi:histidyl-tRNA synthetase